MVKDKAPEAGAEQVVEAEQVVRCGGHVLVDGRWVIEGEDEV